MSENELISVSISMASDRRSLSARVSSRGEPFDVLGYGTVPQRLGAIQIDVDQLHDSKHNSCEPGMAMTRHFVNVMEGFNRLSVRDHGEIVFSFERELDSNQADKLATTIANHLVMMVPLTAFAASR